LATEQTDENKAFPTRLRAGYLQASPDFQARLRRNLKEKARKKAV